MSAGFMWAVKHHYFVDKADLVFHAFVILDVIIEGSLYDAARLAGYTFCWQIAEVDFVG